MRPFTMRALLFLICAVLLASGCGDDGDDANKPPDVADTSGERGGDLTVLSAGDVFDLDPGSSYYVYEYQAIHHPTQRALYGWKPNDTTPSPDLAADMPETSQDGRTVTIKLKPSIRYSPPLQQQTVSSDDVKYALQRTFSDSVPNAYANIYFGAIEGVSAFASGDATEISGIRTPDDTTLVLKLSKPVGVISNGQALSLPASVPVPEDYARKYDARPTSTYGRHQVFTGPYMIKNDGKGTITGYRPGRRLELVRNPSWDGETDFRPAYLDTITFRAGNDIGAASSRILAGKKLASGDFASPPVDILRSALSTRRDQVAITPGHSTRFVALNTAVKPFDRVNVRRAVAAAIDRTALRATRGIAALGELATHFLPPGIPGYELAGGADGRFDFMSSPTADLKLARRYLRKAGYAGGRYSGPPLLMVGESERPASATAAAVRDQLEKLGFEFTFRRLPASKVDADLCGAAKAKVAVCPNGSWSMDFFDGQSLLDPVFNGDTITPRSSVNIAQVDDPELSAGLDIASEETDPEERAERYAEIDRTVSSRAYVVPWFWDNAINIASADVKGVVSRFTSAWDMSYTSLR
ncbi:MAG: ABC transporter substrate-binding protein [Solirubrobacteraceae bacterium]